MGRLKAALTSPWGDSCLSVAVGAVERMGAGRNLLRTLTYHRVDDDFESPGDPGLISATPPQFAAHADWLADRGAVVSLDEALAALRGECPLRPGAVLLTFDDANRCLLRHAWPALRSRGLPAVAFVPTAYPGSDRKFWWDRLHASLTRTAARHWQDGRQTLSLQTPELRRAAYRTLAARVKSLPHDEGRALIDRVCGELGEVEFDNNVLNWDELRQLASEGLALAPHTRTHPLLSRLPQQRAVAEVLQSHDDLCQQIGAAPRVIAYPGGSHDEPLARELQRRGFEAGFTVRRGINRLGGCDPLRLRRINVGRGTTVSLLRAQLLRQTRLLTG